MKFTSDLIVLNVIILDKNSYPLMTWHGTEAIIDPTWQNVVEISCSLVVLCMKEFAYLLRVHISDVLCHNCQTFTTLNITTRQRPEHGSYLTSRCRNLSFFYLLLKNPSVIYITPRCLEMSTKGILFTFFHVYSCVYTPPCYRPFKHGCRSPQPFDISS